MLINNYTIAALATPLGQAPLAIIRVSGENAIIYTSQIFHSKKNILDSTGHEVIFGYIYDPQTNHDVDQVLITVFKAPRSFTGEDMVEITCHGGMILFQKILDLLLKQGCSIAQKGEFSKRAFINGKMDLTQAEAIHDLIFSRSYKVSQLVLNSLKKNLFANIQTIKSSILKLVAKIEVGIDYPEDEIDAWNKNDIIFLESTITDIQTMIESAKKTQTINKGYVVAIIGEPNAGKSSLLNLLLGEEKAIVSSIAGTTRDPIEVFLTLNDMPVTLIDTAGLRDNTDNEIEEMGIAKTKNIMLTADFNILMVDINHYSQEALKSQIEILKKEQVPFLLLWNKIDLATNPMKQSLLPSQEQILLSCKQQVGIEELITYLKSTLTNINTADTQFFINQRQSHLLEQVEFSLNETLQLMKQEELDLEILSLLLQKSLHIIGEIDGSDIQDNILETIFSEFCVGK